MSHLTLRERQDIEALARLEAIPDLMFNIIDDFKKGTVNISKSTNVGNGILYHADVEEVSAIHEVERKLECTVYHGILTATEFGRLLSLFYVSRSPEEWELDRDCLKNEEPFVYVYNLDDPISSDLGYIRFKQENGGLIRTA